jgi:hypothetical protein
VIKVKCNEFHIDVFNCLLLSVLGFIYVGSSYLNG